MRTITALNQKRRWAVCRRALLKVLEGLGRLPGGGGLARGNWEEKHPSFPFLLERSPLLLLGSTVISSNGNTNKEQRFTVFPLGQRKYYFRLPAMSSRTMGPLVIFISLPAVCT